jgi:hypothetical protein
MDCPVKPGNDSGLDSAVKPQNDKGKGGLLRAFCALAMTKAASR